MPEHRFSQKCAQSGGSNVLLLGAGGGVGTAVLTLLERHPLGMELRERIGQIFLLDGGAPLSPDVVPPGDVVLPSRWIRQPTDLARVLRQHRIDQVVELAEVDTLDCVAAAAECGADYLCTGFEVRPELQDTPGVILCGPMVRAQEMLPERRPDLRKGSYLVGSGMNPGVANALVEPAIEQFMRLTGVPDPDSLDLRAIYFTEEDTTREVDGLEVEPSVFPMTWSPEHCLWEVLEPSTAMMRNGQLHMLGHPPHQQLYQVRCGRESIEGMVIPHEEVVTIGARYPWVETAYVYRLLPAAHRAIRADPERSYDDWILRKLYPPSCGRVEGLDRVGVLLCSRRYGELWVGYETNSEQANPYGTNATLLQVAAGVLSGWKQLGARTGLHFVEELDSGRYLESVSSVLGPPTVVFDPEAVFRPLELRRVAEDTSVARRSSQQALGGRPSTRGQPPVARAAT